MTPKSIFDQFIGFKEIAQMHKEPSSGLGISLEGTVDVEDGKEVRPHHYIRNILPDGPVGRNAILQSGDELLEVNGIQLMGLNHLEVVTILKQLPTFVSLVCARYPVPTRIIDTSQHREAFQARKILADSLQTLIPINERLVKAKSETSLTSSFASDVCNGSRSRSLEFISGLPMWSEDCTIVELNKSDYGLGFSILDYQDPLNPQETVIVIRSLVPGGVAQTDGRLIPGDRLLAVNDMNVSNATLDTAVQVLKSAPRGKVRITVAKPVSTNDGVSYASQFVRKILREWSEDLEYLILDTEDDQTCLEDFQECIEEYQECLEVVHICIDEDNSSFNHSACSSQVEDFGQKSKSPSQNSNANHFLDDTSQSKQKPSNPNNNVLDSDLDLSYKSTKESINNKTSECDNTKIIIKTVSNLRCLTKNDSLTQSDRVSNVTQSSNLSEKDGYETCMDESLSDEAPKNSQTNESKVQKENPENPESEGDDQTPTNFKANIFLGQTVCNNSSSEPCLKSEPFRNICLESKPEEDELKSYYDQCDSLGGDEFFLVQYPPDINQEVTKSYSEPNVLDTFEIPVTGKLTYRLKEYYNDYADCLDSYKVYADCKGLIVVKEELSDDVIFNEIFLPFKSRSAPDIMDSSFIMLTYDPGPDRSRRKSAFVPGYQTQMDDNELPLSITAIRQLDGDYGALRGCDVNDMLQKHWGSIHTVQVFREPNTSLGISIVGGKVDLHASDSSKDTVLGIFVKNVVPDSPAGKTGQFQTGDRILEVSGVDLREASHETAVEAIRKASNPVCFIVQSFVPWTFEKDNNSINSDDKNFCISPFPSPVKTKMSESPEDNEKKIADEINNENEEKECFVLKEAELEKIVVANKTVEFAEVIEIKEDEERKKEKDLVSASKENEEKIEENVGIVPKIEGTEESDEEEEEEDARELEGRTVSTKGQQIDRASAGNVKRTQEEIDADPEEEDDFGYTMNKVKKKYANLGHSILMVQLERSSQGLGLSLAGHKDRNCMAVFVCGLNPNGAAFKAGGIQVGDEILEVNGVVLHGRCHLNASAIIKGLSGPIFKVVILRRKTAIDDIAVKPITQFPVSLAEEASEEQFSASYPNVRTVAIKKGTQSLGIMIIEGKHAEVGQGIFISDIQEGSSAEKAGLEIGEMILAVNKDSLVGSNYDTAASLLKRTEGLVTLVVSNPGRKEPPPSSQAIPPIVENNKTAAKPAAALKASASPSRPATPVPEPPADPSTCSIVPGKDVTIEIVTDNKGLGIFFVGGKDTLIPNGIVVVEIYPGGTADKDSRLQPGDQILDVNGNALKDVTNTTASQALRQTLPKMKMIVYRPETIEYSKIDIDLMKKPGKGLGLSVIAKKSGKGVYIADIINGGTADVDGRIMKGDLLVSVNGHSLENSSGDEAGAILKTVMGKVSLKLHRYKPVAR